MQRPDQQPSISTTVLLSLYNDLSAQRETFDRGLARFGVNLRQLRDFQGRISLLNFVRLFEWLAAETGEPCLGLKASQLAGPHALGAVGYLFLSSGTLELALQSLKRYVEVVQSASSVELDYVDDLVQISYRLDDDQITPRRQDSEYSIGIMWQYMKLLSKNRCRLLQVSFEHSPGPRSGNTYMRTFGAPVLFNQPANEMTVPIDDLRRWHEGLDPHLLPILESHITNALNHSRSTTTFTESVKDLLTEAVIQQGARADKIAQLLKISPVTLHGKLRREGVRFKTLVDIRSKSIAQRLLRENSLPVSIVSQRLGFTDPAAFTRAFRRWFATTPSHYRKTLKKTYEEDAA